MSHTFKLIVLKHMFSIYLLIFITIYYLPASPQRGLSIVNISESDKICLNEQSQF